MDGASKIEEKVERATAGGVQSVEVAGKIIQVLVQADGPMKLAEIAAAVGMPSAKVHRYLVSLIRTGLAQQSKETSKYDLGPTSFQLGLKGFARFEPLKLAENELQELVELVGETAALAIWTEKGPAMIRVIEARHDYAMTIAPTHHCPMTFSATGLLFCSFEEASRTDPLIERELAQNKLAGRPHAPRERTELAEMISRTRDQGYACMINGGGDGFGAVSAPVFDVTGKLSLAVTVFGKSNRVDAGCDSTLARIVSKTAAKISGAFGYQK